MYSIRLIVSLQSKQVNMTKPLILISNDDGYHSRGLRYLCEFLSDMADILVCAPESPRSGYSCAFSAEPPIYLKRRKKIVGAEVWSCSGTPADCVKIALDRLTPHRRPDMVIGGINHGDNSPVNTLYSGTMGVAMEGCMKYIPSIAFSSCDYDPDADLSHLRDGVRMIVQRVLSDGLPKGVCLNVNFPKVDHFEGVKICRMGYGSWTNEILECDHPRKGKYYWMVGYYHDDEPGAMDNDRWALEHGYIAITPTTMDVTAYDVLESMKNKWE